MAADGDNGGMLDKQQRASGEFAVRYLGVDFELFIPRRLVGHDAEIEDFEERGIVHTGTTEKT